MNMLALHQSRWLVLLLLLSVYGNASAQLSARFTASPLSGCAPLVVQFSDNSTGNPTTWRWDLGNGVVSTLRNPSTTYFNPGTYTVKLVARTAAGKDSLIKSAYITVNPSPVLNFGASDSLGCFPFPVHFTDKSTTEAGSMATYTWDFGDGTLSTLANPTHIYNSAGNFSVTLKAANTFGCTKTFSKKQYIKISNGVTANFTNQALSQCKAPVTINFTNTSTGSGLQYTWNFGDGTTSTAINPVHTYSANGSYTVSLTAVTPQGCVDTIVKQNLVSIGAIKSDFTLPAAICNAQTFTITNATTPVPGSVSWTFGDGTKSEAINPEHTFSRSGVYTIKLVNDFGGCTDSISKEVTVIAKPKPDFSANPTQSCKAPFTVNFTNNTPGNNTYKWDFGDSTYSTEAQPTHTYTTAGQFTVTLIAFNENGCSDTVSKSDVIQIQRPLINIQGLPATGCTPLTINPVTTITSVEPIVGYLWDFGDGTTSTALQPSHVYTTAGNYNISLTVTNGSGCSDSVLLTNAIRIGDKPKAQISATPTDVCAATAVQFSDKSVGKVDQWHWDFGDKHYSDLQNPTHIFDGIGKFPVSLIVWSNTCPDTIKLDNMINVRPPIAKFILTNNCNNRYQKTFIDSSIGAVTWYWNFGDGTTSTEKNPVHTYNKTGFYKVELTVTNGSCSHSVVRNALVIDEKAAWAVDQSTICHGNSVMFTTPTVHRNLVSASIWNFGDGNSVNVFDTVSHTYAKSGIYKASLTIRDILGCSDTKNYEVSVSGPVANFQPAATAICLGKSTVNFIDSSRTDGTHAINQWIWNYGDGKTDTYNTPVATHTYSTAGDYDVVVKVVDEAGCSDTLHRQKVLTVAKPLADFTSPDTTSCVGKPVTFLNKSTGYNLKYQWSLGDGSAATAAAPAHQYSHVGMYDVKLSVIDKYGCTDTAFKSQYINISLPKASFTVSDTLGTCPPLLVHFTNTSTNYIKIRWDFGDGNSSILDTPSHYYTVPGIYYAKVVVTGPGGCTDSASRKIEVRGPKGTFEYHPVKGCKPLEIAFTSQTQNRLSFIWDFRDGTTISTKDSIISHTYLEAGEYLPKMILIDANGCSVPIVGKDTVRVYGIRTQFSADQHILCDSGWVKFANTTVSNDLITSYNWNFGDGTTSKEVSPLHRYQTKGSFAAKLVVTTQTGCTDSLSIDSNIDVYQSPRFTLTGDTSACVPATLPFRTTVLRADEPLQWTWNFGNGQQASVAAPMAPTYSEAKNYALSVSATDVHGCKTTMAKTVSIHPLPVTDAGKDALVCSGQSTLLQPTGATTYVWKAHPELSCTTCSTPLAVPTVDRTFSVTGTNQFGCSSTDSVTLRVRQHFTLAVNPGDTICAGDVIHLWATGADKYKWFPSTGLDNATLARPHAKPEVTTVYNVVAADGDNCFADTAHVVVKVNPLPKVEAGSDVTMSAGGSIQLKTTNSADVVKWGWTPNATLSCATCANPTAAPKQTTQYHVEVKNAGGCTSSDDVTVSVICNNGNLFIPNTFTPNGDGVNDLFFPRGTGIALIRSLRIFNRWGEVVFERINFNANDASAGWDGTYKGQKLSPDVYIYSCDVVCMNNEVLTYKGDITLLK